MSVFNEVSTEPFRLVLTLLVLSAQSWFLAEAVVLQNSLTFTNNTALDNTTRTTSGFLNFIRPAVNPTANCNIWGPLCQTGPIVVGVNLTTTVKTTTVSCSEYLSAQAESALPGYLEGRGDYHNYRPPRNGYQMSFGRSPECKYYAQHFENNPPGYNAKQPVGNDYNPIITPSGSLTLSNCGSDQTREPAYYTPPGVSNSVYGMGGPGYDYYCCGDCSLRIEEIRLLYFPGPKTINCSMSHGSTSLSSVLIASSNKLDRRGASLLTNGSVLISDGYTYTSPSFYLQIVGTASVSDSCGVVGSIYTNPIVAVPMGGLSTISLNLSIGATFNNVNFGRGDSLISSYTKVVKTEDLVCPTWGLANSTIGSLDSVGPPFNPIIHPPSELINLDPAWRQCSRFVQTANAGGFYLYEIFDPPRALSPVAGIAPSIAPADPTTLTPIDTKSVVLPSAKPADSVSPTLPDITPKPSLDPEQSIVVHPHSSPLVDPGQKSPSDPGRLPSTNVVTIATDAPKVSSSTSSKPVVLQDPKNGAEGVLSSDEPNQHTEQGIGASIHSVLGGIVTVPRPVSDDLSLTPAKGNVNQPTAQGLGGLIYSAFDASRSAKNPDSNGAIGEVQLPTSRSARLIFTVGGSTITTNPLSSISIGRTTISAGGPAVKIAGTVLSIGPSGLMIGTSIVPVQSAALDSTVVHAAGQAITISDPSAVAVEGSTLSVGGDPVTLAHTILSLAPSGKLMIKPKEGHNSDSANIAVSQAPNFASQGSSSIAVFGGYNEMTATPAIFTIAGKVFTVNPSAFSIDGTMLSVGGNGIIISGTSISLASSGHLIIGSSTEVLPNPSIFKAAGQTFTANPSAFSIDSTTLSVGGAGITISGTPISLGPSGNLKIGSSTVMLSQSPATAPPLSTFTIDGQTFIGNASALSVDGNTLHAGGAGVTILGISISLEASATLRIGSSNIPIATNGSFELGKPEEFTGAQRRPAIPGARVLLGAIVLTIGIIEVNAMWKL